MLKLDSARLDVGMYSNPSAYGRGGSSTCSAIRGSLRLSGIADGKAVECAKIQLLK